MTCEQRFRVECSCGWISRPVASLERARQLGYYHRKELGFTHEHDIARPLPIAVVTVDADNYYSPDERRSPDLGRNQDLSSLTPQSTTPFTDNHRYPHMSFLGRLARAIKPTHHGIGR